MRNARQRYITTHSRHLEVLAWQNSTTTHLVPLRLAYFKVRHLGRRVEHVERARVVLAEFEPVGLVAAVIVSDSSERDAALRHRQRFPSRVRNIDTDQHQAKYRDPPRIEHHASRCKLLGRISVHGREIRDVPLKSNAAKGSDREAGLLNDWATTHWEACRPSSGYAF